MESSEVRGGVRGDILAMLAEGPLSAPELASRLGLHVTTVRFHLGRLEDQALLARERSTEHHVGRPRLLYRLRESTQAAPAVGTEPLQTLATVLMAGFHRGEDGHAVTPEEAGERWSADHAADVAGVSTVDRQPARTSGQWLAKVGNLVDLLDSWGYAPRLESCESDSGAQLRLADCPFLELARADPGVVCGIHAGLIRGAMREFGEPGTTVELHPFTDPPLCTARITRNTSTHNPRGT